VSGRFLAIEHSFRVMTEPGTRTGLKGSFARNHANSVGNLHGWADGDEFYVNYIGHPMQGSVAGFLWVQNDRSFRHAEFGKNEVYWKSRLRAAAFAWAYSTQFEIGPFSEGSIGAIQASFPQQGFVDHVVTPTLGLGWMVVEDALDKYVIKRIEAGTTNRGIRLLTRATLNPSRTFASVLQGRTPWHRDTRPGISQYVPGRTTPAAAPGPSGERRAEVPDTAGPPPFEFNVSFQPERLWGGGRELLCIGGGASAAFRVARAWQLVVDAGGCKLQGLETDLSGDSLTYMAGPRWVYGGPGPWAAHWQFLVGGNKITEERMWPEKRKLLEAVALQNKSVPPSHAEYTDQVDANGLALTTGGGVDYKLNPALAIRVAQLSYRRSWAGTLWGRDYSHGLKLVSGLVLRIGTW
jgi:hypothetical protein